jgi:RNA polymerase sigma-70 factor (ECF subfamily)
VLSLDTAAAEGRYLEEPRDALDAEELYARRWASALLERALSRLEEEAATAGKAQRFARLKGLIAEGEERGAQQRIADELRMSVGALRVAVHRLRRRWGELIRDEVAAPSTTRRRWTKSCAI